MQGFNTLIPSDHDRWFDSRPSLRWTAAYRTYDRLALRLTARHPQAGFRALTLLGHLANRCALHGPSPGELADLYGPLPRRLLARVARDVAALRLKNRAANAIFRRAGIEHLARLVRSPGAVRLEEIYAGKRPALLIAWHVGPLLGVSAALHRAKVPALILRNLPLNSAAARSRTLKQAVDHLRGGGLVLAVPDGPGGANTDHVECLGRRVVLRRGPFMLARVTGAPIIPIVTAWEPDGSISVRVDPPLDRRSSPEDAAASFDHELAGLAARWLEAYLRAEPQEIWLWTLRNFLEAPRVGSDSHPRPSLDFTE